MTASASHLLDIDSIAEQIHQLSVAYETLEETTKSTALSSGILKQWTNLQKEQNDILSAYATLSKSQDNRIEYQLALSLKTQIQKQLDVIQKLDNKLKRQDKNLTQINEVLQQEATEISQAIKKSNQTIDAREISKDEKNAEQIKKEKEAKLKACLHIVFNLGSDGNPNPSDRMVDAYEKICREDLLSEEEKKGISPSEHFYHATFNMLHLANSRDTPVARRARQVLINAANDGFIKVIEGLSAGKLSNFLSARESWKYSKMLLKQRSFRNIDSFGQKWVFYYDKMVDGPITSLNPIKLSTSEKEIIIEGAEFFRYKAFHYAGLSFNTCLQPFRYAFLHLDPINKNIFLLNAIAVLSVCGSHFYVDITEWNRYIKVTVEGSETKLNAKIDPSEQDSLKCLVSYIPPFNQLAEKNPALIAYFLLEANFSQQEVENIYRLLRPENIERVDRYHSKYQEIILTFILLYTFIPVDIARVIMPFIDPIKSIHDIAIAHQSISDQLMALSEPREDKAINDFKLSNLSTINTSISQISASLFTFNTKNTRSTVKNIRPRGYGM